MKHVGVLTNQLGTGDPEPNRRRWRLGPTVRGTADGLKRRVVKKRERRKAAHIDKSMKHIRGSHEWARAQVRMIRAFGGDF